MSTLNMRPAMIRRTTQRSYRIAITQKAINIMEEYLVKNKDDLKTKGLVDQVLDYLYDVV